MNEIVQRMNQKKESTFMAGRCSLACSIVLWLTERRLTTLMTPLFHRFGESSFGLILLLLNWCDILR